MAVLLRNAPFDVFDQIRHGERVEGVGKEDLIGSWQHAIRHEIAFFEMERCPEPLHVAHLLRTVVVQLDHFADLLLSIFGTQAKMVSKLKHDLRFRHS